MIIHVIYLKHEEKPFHAFLFIENDKFVKAKGKFEDSEFEDTILIPYSAISYVEEKVV